MESSKVEGVIPSCESLIELFDKRVYAMLDLYRFLGAVFSLKLIHVYEKFHVRIFRKQEGSWMCYDGIEVRSEPVPWEDVYLLVYESKPSIKEKE